MSDRQAPRITHPVLRHVQSTIDKGMTARRHIRGEHTDLAVCDLTRRASILARDAARCLALLEKTGLVDHQNSIGGAQMLDNKIADEVP